MTQVNASQQLQSFAMNSSLAGTANNGSSLNYTNSSCLYQLSRIYYHFAPSYSLAIGWIVVFLVSTLLNAVAVRIIMKKERFTSFSAMLLNIFIADLTLGSLIYASRTIGSLKLNVCLSKTVTYTAFYAFTDVSLLSLANIATKQAEVAGKLRKLTLQNAGSDQEKLTIALKLALVWIYSMTLALLVAFVIPDSKVWIIQAIVILLTICALHCYSLRKMSIVLAEPSNDNNEAMVKRRAQRMKKGMKLVMLLLAIEVSTWIPIFICALLYVSNAITLQKVSAASYWTGNAVMLSPMLNPIVLFLGRHALERRRERSMQSRQPTAAVVPQANT
eukprot:gene3649-4166_t